MDHDCLNPCMAWDKKKRFGDMGESWYKRHRKIMWYEHIWPIGWTHQTPKNNSSFKLSNKLSKLSKLTFVWPMYLKTDFTAFLKQKVSIDILESQNPASISSSNRVTKARKNGSQKIYWRNSAPWSISPIPKMNKIIVYVLLKK